MSQHADPTPMATQPDTTQLLRAASAGDRAAFDLLFARVYGELRRIARHRLRRHRGAVTIETTGLIHEAYLRLVVQTHAGGGDRAHFLALASRAMRFVLVDLARARGARKRGGGASALPLDEAALVGDQRADEVLALDEALQELQRHDERLSRTVEYRYFGGLTFEEIAAATGRSVPTVKRDWVRARTWLYRAMRADVG